MKLAIVGTGYVGLVTGTCFAESGNEVTCIDNSSEKIATLQRGGLPIYEPGLLEMVERNRREERLHFTTNLAEGIAHAQLVFIAVGTPQDDDGSADLSYVDAVTDDLCKAITGPKVVVIKSTVPPGTNKRVSDRLVKGCKHKVEVCSNPEFLREGTAIEDCLKPDRVVVGVHSEAAAELFHELYQPFVDNSRPLLVMSPESAEMTKYAANAILAMKISYINEVANLCERVEADVSDLQLGVGHDSRIGFQFLSPGAGYGGSCFPKDTRALISLSKQVGLASVLIEAVDRVNEAQKKVLVAKVRKHFGDRLAGRTLAVWGLAFKPGTDDIREAPALVLLKELLAAKVQLHVHDPEAMTNVRREFGNQLSYFDRPYGALEGADGLIIVTEWRQFRTPDFELMRRLLAAPVIFDGRNLYNPRHMAEAGFTYYSIGRQPAVPAAKEHSTQGTAKR
jgi:UDPglucose 6-dehydrogenase